MTQHWLLWLVGSHPHWCALASCSIFLVCHGTWAVYPVGRMLVLLQERSGIAVRSVRGLCHCRNLSVLTSCNKCFAWRHLLQAVLLAPVSRSCTQCEDNEESGELCLNIFRGTPRTCTICPPLTASSSLCCPILWGFFHLPGRSGKTLPSYMPLSERAIFSCQRLYALIARI